jgi:arylsulfatase A-like enzyme
MPNRAVLLCLIAACAPSASTSPVQPAPPPDRSVVIVVWDGLRPDAISAADTPNLVKLRDAGTEFTDHHSTYPTLTMMNAASFATGAFPDATGFYGNVVWQPDATGSDSAGKPVDFRQPVFSEDYAVLDALKVGGKQLLLTETLFDAAHAAGLTTAAIGKSGAAYMQDMARGGLVIDEKAVLPLAFARELQAAGFALPATAPNAFAPGELVIAAGAENPVAFAPVQKLKDGVSADPTDDHGSPFKPALSYMVHVYMDFILPNKQPRLTVLWLRDPDSTQHNYGIGSRNWHDALRANDALLGQLRDKLAALGKAATTDLLIVSDHGHSNVSAPQELFPLRAVAGGAVGGVDPAGHSVSGMVRLADLLQRAGFTVFDGLGCTFIPVATGLRGAERTPVYADHTDDSGAVCGKEGQHFQVAPHKVPAQLPAGALVVAVNGGSDYVYVPDHDPATLKKAVEFLQRRAEVGAIFIDDRYGALPGTLPLSAIHARNAAHRNPDLILSYDFDAGATINGVLGTEMAGVLQGNGYHGMHGSFSPRDVHNTLIAAGPDFKAGEKDALPSGNVDVAPTVARILGLALPHAQGRPLLEAMVHGAAAADFEVVPRVVQPAQPATGLSISLPTDPDGKDVAPGRRAYSFELHTKSLKHGDQTYTYFDYAKAQRR